MTTSTTTGNELFLITGATGYTGEQAVRSLLERGRRVRAFVHTLDERSARLEELGAEIVAGDLMDLYSLSSAMRGVTGAYLCYSAYTPGLLEATAIFAQAASEAGIRSVVNMSQISARRESKSGLARAHWMSERLLDRTAMLTTHLRPTFFMNVQYHYWVRQGDEGVYRLPFADVPYAPIDGGDMGRVIAAVLENPESHNRQIYPLYGAELVNYHEIAAKVEKTLGIPVRYEPIDFATWTGSMAAAGGPPHLVQHAGHVAQNFLDGIFSGTNNLVEVISGVKPRTVEDFVEANRSLFETSGPFAITDAQMPVA